MKIKNIPFSVSITVTLLSWNVVAQADTLQSNNDLVPDTTNPDHNWMPQQSDNNYWQAPNWSDFQTPVRPVQKPQVFTNQQMMKNPEFHRPAVTAPALQVPTMNERSFVTESAPVDGSTPAASVESGNNSANKTSNIQNRARQGMPSNNLPAMNIPPQMPGFSNNYRPPMPQGYYRPPYQQNPYQRPFATPMYPQMAPMPYGSQPYPPANMYQGYRPPGTMNQSTVPGQSQHNNQSGQPPVPNYVPPSYNRPYYNGYNNRFNNNNWGNNFWGRSGPGTWMNPNKHNMEQGWDDMINAPSRMGTMPGGWNAPEITMPNPIDLGDQFQDNVQDLPEQLRNMDVGN